MKKIIVLALCFMTLFMFHSIKGESDASILVVTNQLSYETGELINISLYTNGVEDLSGLQVDIKKNAYFRFANGIEPYMVGSYLTDNNFSIYKNGFDSNYQDIASLILIKDSGSININEAVSLVSIQLVALQSIEDIRQLITVTDNFNDVSLDLATMSIKLADSNAQAISYTSVFFLGHRIELKPGIDTVFLGESHVDGGYELVNISAEDAIVTVETDVDTSIAGEYQIVYTAKNPQTNITSVVFRRVFVIEPSDVWLSLKPSVDTYQVNDDYQDMGALAYVGQTSYPCDVLYTNVDMTQSGVYQVIYGYEHEGVMYRISRLVHVLDSLLSIEELTLNTNNEVVDQ